MIEKAPNDEAGVLAAAQNQDRPAYNAAIQRLINDVLLPVAAAAAGTKRDRVDLQPRSIVQAVIAKNLPAAVEQCSTESHLKAWLCKAISNEIIDRSRKGGSNGQAVQFSQPSERTIDPPAQTRGPATRVADAEAGELGDIAFAVFSQQMLSLLDNPVDQALVTNFILRGMSWVEAAAGAGISIEAARKRMSRCRGELLTELCEPLRSMLDGEGWAVAEWILIHRKKLDSFSVATGMRKDQAARVWAQQVSPALVELYGQASLEPMQRLIGK